MTIVAAMDFQEVCYYRFILTSDFPKMKCELIFQVSYQVLRKTKFLSDKCLKSLDSITNIKTKCQCANICSSSSTCKVAVFHSSTNTCDLCGGGFTQLYGFDDYTMFYKYINGLKQA